MRASLAVALPFCVVAVACGGSTSPTAPSAAIPSPTAVTANLSGSVRDVADNAALANVMVQIANGPDVEKFATTDANGSYTLAGVRVGAFVVRFTRAGYEDVERTVSIVNDARLDVSMRRGPSCPRLEPPTGFRVEVAGSTVTYRWNPVAAADDYLLGIGPSPGSSRTRSTNTTQTEYVWRGMRAGTYYARVVARNACYNSNNSIEVTFTVGG